MRTSVWYTVDRDHVIVDAAPDAHPAIHASMGQHLFCAFPGLDTAGMNVVLRDAWRDKVASRVVMYAGTLGHVVASTETDGNPDTVTITVAAIPLAGLKDSLVAAESWLADRQAAA